MNSNKPTVVFTTFWDADNIVKNQGFIHSEDEQLYKVDIEENKLAIYSIALGTPDLSKMETYKLLNTIDCFCPTWSTLKKYKADSNWDEYTSSYHRKLMTNKHEVADIMDGLEPDNVYILCCWENTCKGAHCHRHLLYNALKSANRTKGLANYVYRHGDKKQAGKDLKILESLNKKKEDKQKGRITHRGRSHEILSYYAEQNECIFTTEAYGQTIGLGAQVLLESPIETLDLVVERQGTERPYQSLNTETYYCSIRSRPTRSFDSNIRFADLDLIFGDNDEDFGF